MVIGDCRMANKKCCPPTLFRWRMNFVLKPWQLLVFILAGWVQRQQQQILECQNEQIRTLLEGEGRKRIPYGHNIPPNPYGQNIPPNRKSRG